MKRNKKHKHKLHKSILKKKKKLKTPNAYKNPLGDTFFLSTDFVPTRIKTKRFNKLNTTSSKKRN